MALFSIYCLFLLSVCTLVYTLPPPLKSAFNFDSSVKYWDCHHLYKAGYSKPGTYSIWVNQTYPIQVYCENGATVIQRREYGNYSFEQTWKSYVDGFGNMPPARGDFWLGLNTINYLTSQAGNNMVTFVIQDWNSNVQQNTYIHFRVLDATTGYRMFVGRKTAGQLADDFSFNNGMPFATQDHPDPNHCATNQRAGWWFNYCSYALPNGKYYYGGPYTPSGSFYDGIFWKDWMGYGYSAMFISMSVSH